MAWYLLEVLLEMTSTAVRLLEGLWELSSTTVLPFASHLDRLGEKARLLLGCELLQAASTAPRSYGLKIADLICHGLLATRLREVDSADHGKD